MTRDDLTGLRALAEALPPGSAVPVPREWLLDLLTAVPAAPAATPEVPALPNNSMAPKHEDRLLTADEVATRLGVSKDWVYHHRGELPFTVKLGRRVLRFSQAKLESYLETRRRRSVGPCQPPR